MVQAAAHQWIRTEKWFPRPAELITLANEIAEEQMRAGLRALPASTRTLGEELAQYRRTIAKAAEAGIRLHPSWHATLAQLEAESWGAA